MRKKIFITPSYYQLSDFVYQIPETFDTLGKIVHDGRNQIRIVDIEGISVVIKYFKRITLANKFIYAHFRKSKAQRAYEHSELFLSKQINSPQPVAYINCFDKGLLVKSYYVSLYTDYRPIEDLLTLPFTEFRKPLETFGRFTYRLHKNGLFHQDYNIGNILFKLVDNQYDFTLIDNNRLKIQPYTLEKSLKSMCRLYLPAECLDVVATGYADAAGVDKTLIINSVSRYREQYMKAVAVKLKWKALKKLIRGGR